MEKSSTSQGYLASDGERMRELWAPGDGPGDSDLQLIHSSQNRADGHPTWKLFCGELSDGPPPRVYLDDKACYDIIQSNHFTGNQRGKLWPFDFGQHGYIRALRPNRGRPAEIDIGDGEKAIATCLKQNAGGVYYFYGEYGDPKERSKRKRRPPGFVETQETLKRMREDKEKSPGPMDIVRMDRANMAAALANLRKDASGKGDDPVSTGEDSTPRPFSHVEQAELESIRTEHLRLVNANKSLEKRLAHAQRGASKAANENLALQEELMLTKEQADKHFKSSNEAHATLQLLKTELGRKEQDWRVSHKMNETLAKENDDLKAQLQQLRTAKSSTNEKSHSEVKKLKDQVDLLTVLATSFYSHYEEMKVGVRQAEEVAKEQAPEASQLLTQIALLGGVRDATVLEIEDAREHILARGNEELWLKIVEGAQEG